MLLDENDIYLSIFPYAEHDDSNSAFEIRLCISTQTIRLASRPSLQNAGTYCADRLSVFDQEDIHIEREQGSMDHRPLNLP